MKFKHLGDRPNRKWEIAYDPALKLFMPRKYGTGSQCIVKQYNWKTQQYHTLKGVKPFIFEDTLAPVKREWHSSQTFVLLEGTNGDAYCMPAYDYLDLIVNQPSTIIGGTFSWNCTGGVPKLEKM